jgi:hypothetical protein
MEREARDERAAFDLLASERNTRTRGRSAFQILNWVELEDARLMYFTLLADQWPQPYMLACMCELSRRLMV